MMTDEKQKAQAGTAEQKTSKTSAKKETTQKPSKDPHRLKRAWEKLQKQQDEISSRRRKSKAVGQISGVRIVKDGEKEKVQVDMVGGGKILDEGDKGHLYRKMQPQQKISRDRLSALMKEVKEHGYAAVAAGLPPELAEILKRACENNGIRLSEGGKSSSSASFKPMAALNFDKKPSAYKPPSTAERMSDMLKNFSLDSKRAQNTVHILKNTLIQQEKDRLAQVKKEVRDQFNKEQIEEYRKDLYGKNGKAAGIKQKLAAGQKLTQTEQALWDKKQKYGIKANAADEKLTPEQKQAREKMTARDYTKERTERHKAEIQRKTAICETKVHAIRVAAETTLLESAKGGKIAITQESLAAKAIKLVPPREQRNISNLVKTSKQLKSQEEKTHEQVVKERKLTEKHIQDELRKAMALEGQNPQLNHQQPALLGQNQAAPRQQQAATAPQAVPGKPAPEAAKAQPQRPLTPQQMLAVMQKKGRLK